MAGRGRMGNSPPAICTLAHLSLPICKYESSVKVRDRQVGGLGRNFGLGARLVVDPVLADPWATDSHEGGGPADTTAMDKSIFQ